MAADLKERIEVGYKNIGSVYGKEYYHKFLIYTDKNGQQQTISGWTNQDEITKELPYGNIKVLAGIQYDTKNPDHPYNIDGLDRKQYRELIVEKDDLSKEWGKMIDNAVSKDGIYPYDPLKQNSNTLADSVLRENGFKEPEKDGFLNHYAPGSGEKLDKTLKPNDVENRPISDNLNDLISAIEPNNETEKMYVTLHNGLAGQIADKGGEKWTVPMLAEMTHECIKKGINADKIAQMGINEEKNTIYVIADNKRDFAAVDAIEASTANPSERLQEANQLHGDLAQQLEQKELDRQLQLAQQQERGGQGFT